MCVCVGGGGGGGTGAGGLINVLPLISVQNLACDYDHVKTLYDHVKTL